jgi:MerR family transcriptional regulator/heat shock protein HspR
MDKEYITRIVIHPYRASATYSEPETVVAAHLGAETLHHFRALGLVEGNEVDGELRYSEAEVTRLRRIRRLQHDLGVNLAGVEVILHLLEHLDGISRELEQERRKHEH